MKLWALLLFGLTGVALAQRVEIGSGSVVQTVTRLKAGQFVWAPRAAPQGPMLLLVNISTQRALLFRNGVPIGATTVSTGMAGHGTPTGVFSILQKQAEHYSSKYNSAPMPYMQRLTWGGVALHAGNLPGYPASHGCIRLPPRFAALLYSATNLGMTVVITDTKVTPRIAPAPQIVSSAPSTGSAAPAEFEWHPEIAPSGPLSVVVSGADRKAIVLRNGVEIGAAAVTIDGGVTGTWAYTLRNIDGSGQHWMRVSLSSDAETDQPVPRDEWKRFHAPDAFRDALKDVVQPGTTVVITSDSLVAGPVATPVTVIDADARAQGL